VVSIVWFGFMIGGFVVVIVGVVMCLLFYIVILVVCECMFIRLRRLSVMLSLLVSRLSIW